MNAMRSSVLVFFGLCFFAVGLLTQCSKSKPAQSETKSSARAPTSVTLFKAETKNLSAIIKSFAVLTGRQQAEVYTKVTGRIQRVKSLTDGTPVRLGQTLFFVDRQDPGESYKNVPVVSPLSGRIGRWLVDSGTVASAQEPVVLVVDDTQIHATIDIPPSDWLQLSTELKVTAVVSPHQEEWPAQIISISRAADPKTGKGSAEIQLLPKPDAPLRSGMSAEIRVVLPAKKRTLIPSQAVRFTSEGAFIFVVDENLIAQRTPIRYELWNADWVDIHSPNLAGMRIVHQGINLVSHGKPVKILNEAQP